MIKSSLIIFSVMLYLVVFLGTSYAQSAISISVSTNKSSYQPGDKVIITGSVYQVLNGNPVTIIVRNPIGNVYEVGQVTMLNNIFVHDFVLSDDSQSGVYTINIKYAGQTSSTQFRVNVGQVQIIPVFDNVIKVHGENTTLIKYRNIEVSAIDKSILISVDTSRITSNYVTEDYQIPKQVIDTPGGQLVVKENGNQIDCTQTETDIDRVLECPIQAGTKQLMFIGTVVIPEFGPISMVILAIGITVSMVIFSRYKINQIWKYE